MENDLDRDMTTPQYIAVLQALEEAQAQENGLVLADADPTGVECLDFVDGCGCVHPVHQRDSILGAMPSHVLESRRAVAASLDPCTLQRFAARYSRDGADCALHALREHVAWLASVKPEALCMPRDSSIAHESGALWVCGRSRDGDAVVAFDVSAWHPWTYAKTNAACSSAFRIYAAHTLEVAARVADATLGSGRFIICVRTADRPSLLRPVALRCIRSLIQLLKAHNPDRLRRVYLLGAQPLFHAAWKIIRPWLDQGMIDKITLIDCNDIQAALVDHISFQAPHWLQAKNSCTRFLDPARRRHGDPATVAAAILATNAHTNST